MLPKSTIAYYYWQKIKPMSELSLSIEDYKSKIFKIRDEMFRSNEKGSFESDYKDLIRSVKLEKLESKKRVEKIVEVKDKKENVEIIGENKIRENKLSEELLEMTSDYKKRNFFQRLFRK